MITDEQSIELGAVLRSAAEWVAGQDGVAAAVKRLEADRLPAGVTVRDHVVLPTLGALCGAHPAQSVLRATEATSGGLIESADYDVQAPNAQWASDGIPQMITLRDVRLEGGKFLLDRTWEQDRQTPHVADGVRLRAAGVELDGVRVQNFHGAGVRLWRGTNTRRNGPLQATDYTVSRIGRLTVLKCLSGLIVESGADGKVLDLEVGGARDYGLWTLVPTGRWQFAIVHLYAADVGARTQGGAHRFSSLQTETCRVGWINEAHGTQADAWIAYANTELCGQWLAPTRVSDVDLRVDRGRGLVIERSATSSRIGGGSLQLAAGCDGIVVNADKTRIEIDAWGGRKTVTIGRGVVGCTIDVTCGGCDVGVEIAGSLGAGNTITVRHRGCAAPVVRDGGEKWDDKSSAVREVRL